jgi:hypothetical protein
MVRGLRMWEIGMELRAPDGLDERTSEQLWALYSPHHNVERARFEARRGELDQLALFWHGGELVGMVGVRYRSFEACGERVETIYFGQVFIDERFRGRLLIQRLLTLLYLRIKVRAPMRRVMFWTDALTYKPYILMARYLEEYYPSEERPMPGWVRSLRDQLGSHYYGDQFDSESGTVRKAIRQIRGGVADITERELSDPSIRYYAACNPGHREGHGLLIMCPCSMKNLFGFLAVAKGKVMGSGERVGGAVREEVGGR